MAANGYPLTLHVLCGNCQTVVGAPLGHPIVRCGNCSSLLRVGGAVRLAAEQRMAPAVQQYLQQQQAQSEQRQARSKAASAKAMASLKRFKATKEWISEKGNPECVITAEGECRVQPDKSWSFPCNARSRNNCPFCFLQISKKETPFWKCPVTTFSSHRHWSIGLHR